MYAVARAAYRLARVTLTESIQPYAVVDIALLSAVQQS